MSEPETMRLVWAMLLVPGVKRTWPVWAATSRFDPKRLRSLGIATRQNALTVHFPPDSLKPIPYRVAIDDIYISLRFARH